MISQSTYVQFKIMSIILILHKPTPGWGGQQFTEKKEKRKGD